eukprot:363889-Chlamydomonas_euryale.AAC.3
MARSGCCQYCKLLTRRTACPHSGIHTWVCAHAGACTHSQACGYTRAYSPTLAFPCTWTCICICTGLGLRGSSSIEGHGVLTARTNAQTSAKQPRCGIQAATTHSIRRQCGTLGAVHVLTGMFRQTLSINAAAWERRRWGNWRLASSLVLNSPPVSGTANPGPIFTELKYPSDSPTRSSPSEPSYACSIPFLRWWKRIASGRRFQSARLAPFHPQNVDAAAAAKTEAPHLHRRPVSLPPASAVMLAPVPCCLCSIFWSTRTRIWIQAVAGYAPVQSK